MTTEYNTRDFYLSAFLVASGVQLNSFSKSDGNTVFVFNDSSRLKELTESYFNLKALINPIAYGNALKNLKSIIHANGVTNERIHSQTRRGQ